MISTSEVRIGNQVEYNLVYMDEGTEKRPLGVIKIDAKNGLIAVDDGFANEYGEIELNPIVLTAEVMSSLTEFKERHSNEHWRHYALDNVWYISEWIYEKPIAGFEIKGVFYCGENYLPVKYLHQLQNLYFAHTYTELNIKSI